ncbi:hypothetical protein SCUP234_04672 [Seiridium cupressi]
MMRGLTNHSCPDPVLLLDVSGGRRSSSEGARERNPTSRVAWLERPSSTTRRHRSEYIECQGLGGLLGAGCARCWSTIGSRVLAAIRNASTVTHEEGGKENPVVGGSGLKWTADWVDAGERTGFDWGKTKPVAYARDIAMAMCGVTTDSMAMVRTAFPVACDNMAKQSVDGGVAVHGLLTLAPSLANLMITAQSSDHEPTKSVSRSPIVDRANNNKQGCKENK